MVRASMRTRVAAVVGGFGLCYPGQCLAQQTPDRSGDDIVVTATRRETRLQDTPVAISAYTAEQLARSGARDLRDIAAFTPGLTIGTGEGQGAVPISIRGVGQNDLGIGSDAPIAIYLDGVYLARPYMNLFDLVDVERIEVLRGPQGTLYGRNATGGAINVVTRRPGNEVVIEGGARYGNFNAWGAQALLMSPFSDTLSGKLALSASGHDGYTTLESTGLGIDPEKTLMARAALRWRPTGSLDVQLNADAGYHGMPVVLHDTTATAFRPDRTAIDSVPREDRDYWGVSLDFTYDLPTIRLTSITGYRHAKLANVLDTDASPARVIQFSQFDDTSQVSQELRATSSGRSRLQWLAGIYFFRENAETFSPIYLDFTKSLGLPSVTNQTINASNRTTAYALFGQASYRLTPKLTVTGGLRWSRETKKFGYEQEFTVDIPPLFTSFPASVQQTTWSNVSPRVAVDYKATKDVLLFASYSEGFKSGGSTSVSVITTPAPNIFQPEMLKAFEVGVKSNWLNGDLRLNLTAFHYDYSDLQVRTTDMVGFLLVRNAASARVNGLEVELTARPTARLELTTVAAMLDARYVHFIDPVSKADYAGDHLNRAPALTISLGAQNRFPLCSGADLTVRGEYEYASRSYHQPGDMTAFSRAPTNLINARIMLRPKQSHWSFALFAKNLTDQRYIGHAFPVLGQPRATITPPRVFGFEVRFSQ
jgi:iron complex outermembrane receptor protein